MVSLWEARKMEENLVFIEFLENISHAESTEQFPKKWLNSRIKGLPLHWISLQNLHRSSLDFFTKELTESWCLQYPCSSRFILAFDCLPHKKRKSQIPPTNPRVSFIAYPLSTKDKIVHIKRFQYVKLSKHLSPKSWHFVFIHFEAYRTTYNTMNQSPSVFSRPFPWVFKLNQINLTNKKTFCIHPSFSHNWWIYIVLNIFNFPCWRRKELAPVPFQTGFIWVILDQR